MSFPSGHACGAFAGFIYLSLWLNAHFKLLANGGRFRTLYCGREDFEDVNGTGVPGQRTRHWKLPMCLVPIIIAVIVSGSKVRDMWHHPVDVAAGAALGTLFAHGAYKMVYRGVYDWRVNHIPLGMGVVDGEEMEVRLEEKEDEGDENGEGRKEV
jgi:diacylglycerol diphosphate phosphatase/phosphatidate phosphatase